MILSRRISQILIILAAGILAAGLAGKEFWLPMALVILVGLAWLAKQAEWLPWNFIGSAGLIVFIVPAPLLAIAGFPAVLVLLVVVLSIIAWDLDNFLDRMARAGYVDTPVELERRHLVRAALSGGLGLFLGGIALELSFNLAFGWILFSGLLVTILLNRLMAAFGEKQE